MASSEGFLTEEQREMLNVAPPNTDVLSSSPKPSSVLLSEHSVKAPPGGGKASTAGIAVRHVRRTHSGKHIRVKKVSQARRLAQGETVKIHASSPFPVQIDGEPFIQQPGCLEITHHEQMFMLKKASGSKGRRGHAAAIMTEVLVDAECKGLITAAQKKLLLQQIALQLS